MVSSDGVTITEHEDGSMSITDSVGTGALYAHEVAALRAHFAAERMPEDVQKLVDEARAMSHDGEVGTPAERSAIIGRLTDALEAAYSQNGADRG